MKVIASVSIEHQLDDLQTLDEAKEIALEKLIDVLDDWLTNNGIPPIIKIEYKLPEYPKEQYNA